MLNKQSTNTIFNARQDQTIFISTQGLQRLLKEYDPKQPTKNVLWTTNIDAEMPIRINKSGITSQKPVTLIEEFQKVVRQSPDYPALSKKVNQKWITLNYREYFQECINFGKALIDIGLHHNTINIIGFNAFEWNFTFMGALFAQCLPVGIYTTNSIETCHYIAMHSQCKLVIAQNWELAQKYTTLLEKGDIKYIVIYNQKQKIPNNYNGKVILWKEFIERGKKVNRQILLNRMKLVKPGHCCTFVYTSGTTGMPKGAMLSHDNYVWAMKSLQLQRPKKDPSKIDRVVSYLPLSHVAGQTLAITGAIREKMHVFFAKPDALQGSLFETLTEVKSTFFFGVPRIWEKIQQKLRQKLLNSQSLQAKLMNWAMSIGVEGTMQQLHGKPTSFQFKLAKKLIYNKIKTALGLDKSEYNVFGSAPLSAQTRLFFLSLNIFLYNVYGMTQCSGPQTFTQISHFKPQSPLEAGIKLPGTQIKIVPLNPNDQEGEICYRGRHIFMGYYKNPQGTMATIDKDGYLHSGDIGKITKDGVLIITGRLKELIITAGGQNIPPILIQNEIKANNTHISNVMIVGDYKNFLSALLTLKTQPNGTLWNLPYYQSLGSNSKTLKQAASDKIIFKAIKQSIENANKKAISRAQHVQTFAILEEDFTIQNGLLTPTMKLKRKQVLKKYEPIIQEFYRKAKL